MNIIENRTSELWSKFMPNISQVENRISKEFISLQNYPKGYFQDFDPTRTFEKWATVEVSEVLKMPKEMGHFVLEEGNYVVFDYKGLSNDTSIFQYIFNEWLPSSPYQLDNRPHFEVLGEKYKNNDPNSEEEIWIPIQSVK
ncbi:hypothetical protein GCM10011412_07690 [Maribacter cobaltidurans]|nr:hypothetical protein GCM10011412_07690 [Maribacter cobaltidurans]